MTSTTPQSLAIGSWAFSAAHGEVRAILDVEGPVWNHTVYRRVCGFPNGWRALSEFPPNRCHLKLNPPGRPASTASPTPSLPLASPML